MKNINNKILSGILVASMTLGTTSCGDDFLKENANHTTTDALLETGSGALAMAAGLYGNLRWHFGYEWAYAITLYGCDEFSMGSDETSLGWMDYNTAEMNPAGSSRRNHPSPSALWDELYYGIASCNLLLKKAPLITGEQDRNSAMGEAYFLRGYNYYRLFCQYERCPLQLEPIDVSAGVPRNFKLASGEEVLNQVISDLESAYNLLRTIGGEPVLGPNIRLHTSWLRLCSIVRASVAHGKTNILPRPIWTVPSNFAMRSLMHVASKMTTTTCMQTGRAWIVP